MIFRIRILRKIYSSTMSNASLYSSLLKHKVDEKTSYFQPKICVLSPNERHNLHCWNIPAGMQVLKKTQSKKSNTFRILIIAMNCVIERKIK